MCFFTPFSFFADTLASGALFGIIGIIWMHILTEMRARLQRREDQKNCHFFIAKVSLQGPRGYLEDHLSRRARTHVDFWYLIFKAYCPKLWGDHNPVGPIGPNLPFLCVDDKAPIWVEEEWLVKKYWAVFKAGWLVLLCFILIFFYWNYCFFLSWFLTRTTVFLLVFY